MAAITTLVWEVFVGISVICFIFAGFIFLTAMGDSEKIKTAKAAVVWGVVGIIVAIIAFSITNIFTTAFN